MTAFVVIACSKCGKLLAARIEQKTRTCPYCGFRIALRKSKRVATASDAHEASRTLKALKRKAWEMRKS